MANTHATTEIVMKRIHRRRIIVAEDDVEGEAFSVSEELFIAVAYHKRL